MGHKGFAVRWVFRGKCGHGVGFLIQLLLKEDREVIGEDIAQKKFIFHAVYSKSRGETLIRSIPQIHSHLAR